MRCVFRISYVIFVVYIERNIDEPNELNSVFIHTKKIYFHIRPRTKQWNKFQLCGTVEPSDILVSRRSFQKFVARTHAVEYVRWRKSPTHAVFRRWIRRSPNECSFFFVKITEKKGGFYHVIAYASKQTRRGDEFRK